MSDNVINFPWMSMPKGIDALGLLIQQELKYSQNIVRHYREKYGMYTEWPFESFLHARDKILVCISHIRSYLTVVPDAKQFIEAEKLLHESFEKLDISFYLNKP